MLDTSYRIEIPGGINLEAQIVGPIPRFFAFAIDLGIRGIIIFVLSLVSIPFDSFGLGGGFFLIFLFVIEWLYPVLFEVYSRGQTPGKKMLGISVINDDLSPVTLSTISAAGLFNRPGHPLDNACSFSQSSIGNTFSLRSPPAAIRSTPR